MADPLEAYLLKSPATNKQRAELWDAFEAAKDEDDLAARIGAISVPNSVKAGLWDMKASAKPAEPAPMAEPTPTPRDPRLTPTMVSAGDPSVALEMLGGIPGGVGNAVVGAVKAPFQVIGANFDRMERGREKALGGDWGGGLMDAVVGSIPGAPTALAMAQGSIDKVAEAGADAGRGSFLSAVQNLGAAVPLAGPMMDDWGKRWAYASPKERGEILGEVLATAAAPKVASEAIAGAPRVIRPIKGLAQEGLRRAGNVTEAALPGTTSRLRNIASAAAPVWSKRAAALWEKVKGVSPAEAEKAAAKMSEAEFKALEAEAIKAEKQSTAVENKVIRREISDSKKQAAYDRGREARDAHDARQAAKKAPSEPAKAEPKAEAPDDLEAALKASLKPKGIARVEDFSTVSPGDELHGLSIGSKIDNMSSVEASVPNNQSLPGLRRIKFSDMGDGNRPARTSGSTSDIQRDVSLAQQIAKNRRIDPLIVVVDSEGPYILEGSHRYEALKQLGKDSFPAKVIVDLDSRPPVEILNEISKPAIAKLDAPTGAALKAWQQVADKLKDTGVVGETLKRRLQARGLDGATAEKLSMLKPSGDVVHAPPAFPGQQSAKGATKARFADYTPEAIAKRTMTDVERASANISKWIKSKKPPATEVIQGRLNSIFKGKHTFTAEEVETLIKMAKD